ncbi:MAG TPA: hypothetical protein PKY30_25380 [Myxococcota bacterium]|nr:hypothetical protein [Myxococcota bacterium]HND31971.1 hypothetical protein [Myxococcota bacterium]HNH50390.1 hypothetical protein [Myxococcota bacterium]
MRLRAAAIGLLGVWVPGAFTARAEAQEIPAQEQATEPLSAQDIIPCPTALAPSDTSVRVHFTDMKYRVRPTVAYPEAAKSTDSEAFLCKVTSVVDAQGTTVSATACGCPRLFVAAAEEGALSTRYYPYIQNGKPVSTSFVWNMRFVSH